MIFVFPFNISDDTFHGASSELRELPLVELSTLPLVLKVLMGDLLCTNIILKLVTSAFPPPPLLLLLLFLCFQ